MKKQRIFTLFSLISLFFVNHCLCAAALLFKEGDKASYTAHQKLNSEYQIFLDSLTKAESTAIMDFDIKILHADQLLATYDVELMIKKMSICELQRNGFSSAYIKYDSGKDLENVDNDLLAKKLKTLINVPLIFKIEGPFKVTELTSYLTKMYEDEDSPSAMGLFGTTLWSFQLLLTQLFHLSNQELEIAKPYPVSCYELLNWEDEELDEWEMDIQQHAYYTIDSMDEEKTHADWKGHAKVFSLLKNADPLNNIIDGKVELQGHVTWCASNPLIQQRDLKANIQCKHTGKLFQAKVKLLVEQQLYSTP